MLSKQQILARYYCKVAEYVEAVRWEYFNHKHDILEFVPYAPFDLDYYSLRQDAEEELPPEFHSSIDALTYDDCCHYFSGRLPLRKRRGFHLERVLYK